MSLRPHPIETLFIALTGWLPLLGGLALLGMTLLTPEWLGWRELVWQRDMLKLQAESLETQRVSFAQFHEALEADDPVLLERLAYTQLRYKPAGTELINDIQLTAGPVGAPEGMAGIGGGWAVAPANLPGQGPTDVIESWLASPQPVVGKDIQPLRPINSRLTRLTRGPSRHVLLIVAVLCLIAGLLPDSGEEGEAADADLAGGLDPLDETADTLTSAPLRMAPIVPRIRLFKKGA